MKIQVTSFKGKKTLKVGDILEVINPNTTFNGFMDVTRGSVVINGECYEFLGSKGFETNQMSAKIKLVNDNRRMYAFLYV